METLLRSIHNGIDVKSKGERDDSIDHLFTTKEHRQCVSTYTRSHNSSYEKFQSEEQDHIFINKLDVNRGRLFGENQIRNILKAIQS